MESQSAHLNGENPASSTLNGTTVNITQALMSHIDTACDDDNVNPTREDLLEMENPIPTPRHRLVTAISLDQHIINKTNNDKCSHNFSLHHTKSVQELELELEANQEVELDHSFDSLNLENQLKQEEQFYHVDTNENNDLMKELDHKIQEMSAWHIQRKLDFEKQLYDIEHEGDADLIQLPPIPDVNSTRFVTADRDEVLDTDSKSVEADKDKQLKREAVLNSLQSMLKSNRKCSEKQSKISSDTLHTSKKSNSKNGTAMNDEHPESEFDDIEGEQQDKEGRELSNFDVNSDDDTDELSLPMFNVEKSNIDLFLKETEMQLRSDHKNTQNISAKDGIDSLAKLGLGVGSLGNLSELQAQLQRELETMDSARSTGMATGYHSELSGNNQEHLANDGDDIDDTSIPIHNENSDLLSRPAPDLIHSLHQYSYELNQMLEE